MLTLLIAAKSKQHMRTCNQVVISVNGGDKIYIEKNDILAILSERMHGSVIHKRLAEFNLSFLEKALQKHPWVKSAQLYFDNQDVLHVLVKEKEPIVRVFTKSGTTFYLDSAGARMPLLEKTNIRLPVVSNYPDIHKPTAKDSALISDIKNVIAFMHDHDFWKAQIAQIDITDSYELELIPVIGNHIIRFGKGDGVTDKFNRLWVFYQQVLRKAGFDKYRIVDVRYAEQVIGVKREAVAKIDSIQLQKNVENLMSESNLHEADQQQPEVLAVPVNGYGPQGDQNNVVVIPNDVKNDSIHSNPIPLKKETVKKEPLNKVIVHKQPSVIVKKAAVPVKSNPKKTKPALHQKPKAVMHRANEY